jgi:hypothetical protein
MLKISQKRNFAETVLLVIRRNMSEDYKSATSVYDFTVKITQNEDVSLKKYRGKVLLIVNIASRCGLTKTNYEELTEISKKYADKGTVHWIIVGD